MSHDMFMKDVFVHRMVLYTSNLNVDDVDKIVAQKRWHKTKCAHNQCSLHSRFGISNEFDWELFGCVRVFLFVATAVTVVRFPSLLFFFSVFSVLSVSLCVGCRHEMPNCQFTCQFTFGTHWRVIFDEYYTANKSITTSLQRRFSKCDKWAEREKKIKERQPQQRNDETYSQREIVRSSLVLLLQL